MASFIDNQNRKWIIAPVLSDFKRVRAEAEIDLLDIAGGEPPLIARLCDDIVLMVDSIWLLIKPQADKAGVSAEEFSAALDGGAIKQAVEAFWGGLHDFFQNLGRADTAKMIAVMRNLIDRRIKFNDSVLEKARAEAEAGMSEAAKPDQPHGAPSTNSRLSQVALTQGP